MLSAILFDLDGTLLSMDMGEFTRGYFALLAKKGARAGYESEKLIQTVWQGTRAMVQNDGSVSNDVRFWQTFVEVYGQSALCDKRVFDDFYANEFRSAVEYTKPRPELAKQIVDAARTRAEKIVLATNPIFPLIAVEARLSWVGLQSSDFDYVSSYENSAFCKPNPDYYKEILQSVGAASESALMIGNDVLEDVQASRAAGVRAYLVRDCMIGEPNGEEYASGTLDELLLWLKEP